MTYRIIYDDFRARGLMEEYAREHDALDRARELLESGEHHRLAVADGEGNVLHGVRLQLRLGASTRD